MAALTVTSKKKIKGAPRGGQPRRKKGDWVALARGRAGRPGRELVNHPNVNIPRLSDVGSAAYRRLISKRSR